MNIRLYVFPFLAVCIPHILDASEVEIAANVVEVAPDNIGATEICMRYKDTGSPCLRENIGFPESFKGEKFNLINITVKGDKGESTSLEVVPTFSGGFYEVALSGVRHRGDLTNIKLEAVYGDSSSVPLVLTVEFKAFAGELRQSEDGVELNERCKGQR